MSDKAQTPDGGRAATQPKKRDSFSAWNGNSYPAVKLRGFYSDVVSSENAARVPLGEHLPDVEQCHLWQVNTEKHLPLIGNFEPIGDEELRTHLGEQIHGATTEIIKTTDFTQVGIFLGLCSATHKKTFQHIL